MTDPKYINSDYTKLKSIKNCWNEIRKTTGIHGAPKVFRKTFSSLAKDSLGSSAKAIKLTGHERKATLEIHYYKTHKDQVFKNADKVAQVFNFSKSQSA